jgi:hypothetical protein
VKEAYAGVDVTSWVAVKNRQSPITNFGLALRDEPSEASVAALIEFGVKLIAPTAAKIDLLPISSTKDVSN